jgi:hypothetical protein
MNQSVMGADDGCSFTTAGTEDKGGDTERKFQISDKEFEIRDLRFQIMRFQIKISVTASVFSLCLRW